MRNSIFSLPVLSAVSGALFAISAPAFATVGIAVDIDVIEETKETVTYDNPAGTIQITADESVPGGVHIAQIGEQNTISLTQSTTDQLASINQSGDQNRITLNQQGSGDHFAVIEQSGGLNELDLAQDGAAQQIASLTQSGNGNMMLVGQNGSIDNNGIMAIQFGDDNLMSMTQSGSQNHASLTQTGSGNAMTANQTGDNNSLIWSQLGDNLTDLAISQTGSQSIQVTQSR